MIRFSRVRIGHMLAAGVLILTAVLVLAGCSSGAKSGPVTLTFWNAFTGSDGDELKTLVSSFNDANKAKYQVDMNIMSQDAYAQKLPAALATKTGPDFMATGVNDLITYAKQGTIQDISDIFDKAGLDRSNFTQPALDFSQVNGKLYGLPLEIFGIYLYWNKDLFKAAGLDPEKAPATLDELVADAAKITNPAKNQFGFAMPVKGAPQFYANFIRGNGGQVVSPDNKNVFDSPENMKTIEQLRSMAFVKKVSPIGDSGVDMDNVMFSGKLGMYMNGPWLIPGLKSHNINYGVANIPAGSVKASTILDGAIFDVPATTTGAHKTGVYTFLKYWNSTDVGVAWAEKVGFPPYLNSVINDPKVKADPTISVFAGAFSSGIAAPWLVGVPGGGKIDSDVLFPMIEQLQNGATAAEAMKNASAAIDKILSATN